jgi:hypothetical protein
MKNRPVRGRRSETSSHPIDMNNKKYVFSVNRLTWAFLKDEILNVEVEIASRLQGIR